MNRLEKKCVIVSTGLHLSLLGLILVGPAFTSRTTPEVRMIDFMPSMVVPGNEEGGGNPNARPPEATTPPPQPLAQPPPQPKPEPKTAPKPEPERTEPAKNEPPDPNDFTDSKKKKMPEIITKAQSRRRSPTSKTENVAAEKEASKVAAAQLEELRRAIAKTATGIKEGAASATTIDEDFGPGGGGPAYAGYASLVKYVYESAWIAPDDTAGDAAITKVKVTIARDGSVVFSQIINRSGDSQMDASVQRTLDRVRTVGMPFPEGMKEKQRTYILRFDLKVKRGLA